MDKSYNPKMKNKLFEVSLSPPNNYESKSDGYSTPISSQLSDTNNKRLKFDPVDELPSTSKTLSGKKLDYENQFKGINKFHNLLSL